MKPSKKLLVINLEVLKELSGKQRAGVKGGTASEPEQVDLSTGYQVDGGRASASVG